MSRRTIDYALNELPHDYADGLTAEEIADRAGVEKRTVYVWLRREDVREAVLKEIAWRSSVRKRAVARHYNTLIKAAVDIATGEAEVKSPEQIAVLEALLDMRLRSPDAMARHLDGAGAAGETLALPPGTPAAIPAGPIVVQIQQNADGAPRLGRRPVVIDTEAEEIAE